MSSISYINSLDLNFTILLKKEMDSLPDVALIEILVNTHPITLLALHKEKPYTSLLEDKLVLQRLCNLHNLSLQTSFTKFIDEWDTWNLDSYAPEITPEYFLQRHECLALEVALYHAAKRSWFTTVDAILTKHKLWCSYDHLVFMSKALYRPDNHKLSCELVNKYFAKYFQYCDVQSLHGATDGMKEIKEFGEDEYTLPYNELKHRNLLNNPKFATMFILRNNDLRVIAYFNQFINEPSDYGSLSFAAVMCYKNKGIDKYYNYYSDLTRDYHWKYDIHVQVIRDLCEQDKKLDLTQFLNNLLKSPYDPLHIRYFCERYSVDKDLLTKVVNGDELMMEWLNSW